MPSKNPCRFCRDNGLEGCDWGSYSRAYKKECSSCSDHRALSDDINHVCTIQPKEQKALRKYSTYDAHNFPEHFVCTRCVTNKIAFCDVDPYLNLGCSSCQGKEAGVKKDSCKISFRKTTDGPIATGSSEGITVQELTPRPPVIQGIRKWFRRSCDTCVTSKTACNWLDNRSNWTRGCGSCRTNNSACFDSGLMIEGPPRPLDGSNLTWAIKRQKKPAWAELNQATVWRKGCVVCRLAGSHCRVLASLPHHACRKCTQLGLECIEWMDQDPNDKSLGAVAQPSPRGFPLFDLSRVGFGGFMPFDACESCIKKGRNCDQQRPCDSCMAHRDNCDRSTKSRVNMKNCFKGRLDPPPGPLYYLALGYGSGGVDDVKDGSRIEDWLGPPAPTYGRLHVTAYHRSLQDGRSLRNELQLPNKSPPHGGENGVLQGIATADLTVVKLRQLMLLAWPDAHPPNQNSVYNWVMQKWRGQLDDEPEELRKQFPRRTTEGNASSVANLTIDLTGDADQPVYDIDDFGLGPIQNFNVAPEA